MDSVFEAILDFVAETIKLIVYVIIWNLIFFYIGVFILKILSFYKYPVGQQFEKHINVISFVGLNAIYILWSSIATYNYSENIYFLAVGLAVATIQFFLIAMKYYSQYRKSYDL